MAQAMSEKTERMKRRVEAAHDKELSLLDTVIRQQDEIARLKARIEELEGAHDERSHPQ
ncbi:MAG: hypothetical protein K9L88_10325 [Chromatiaceae bacterium]|nr:hypothetical protein [Chromatiaceae bacterium]